MPILNCTNWILSKYNIIKCCCHKVHVGTLFILTSLLILPSNEYLAHAVLKQFLLSNAQYISLFENTCKLASTTMCFFLLKTSRVYCLKCRDLTGSFQSQYSLKRDLTHSCTLSKFTFFKLTVTRAS